MIHTELIIVFYDRKRKIILEISQSSLHSHQYLLGVHAECQSLRSIREYWQYRRPCQYLRIIIWKVDVNQYVKSQFLCSWCYHYVIKSKFPLTYISTYHHDYDQKYQQSAIDIHTPDRHINRKILRH